MINIRVIGLDDDIHSPLFVTEEGVVMGDTNDLIRTLAAPHANNYEIRMFSVADDILECFECYDIEEFYELFDDLIAGNPKDFEVFWKSSRKDW